MHSLVMRIFHLHSDVTDILGKDIRQQYIVLKCDQRDFLLIVPAIKCKKCLEESGFQAINDIIFPNVPELFPKTGCVWKSLSLDTLPF